MFGQIFWPFIGVVAVLGVVGLVQLKTAKKGNGKQNEESVLPERIVENVNDLNDRFNRARYQDKDGE